jgi:hypothetical protein
LEAASLAHYWHQVDSPAALLEARKRYGLALRMMHGTLTSKAESQKDTTVFTIILLDVFEKITDPGFQRRKENASHLQGALGVVQMRGFENFKDETMIKVLIRLYHHCVAACIARGGGAKEAVVDELRAYLFRRFEGRNSGIGLSEILIEYACLRTRFSGGKIGREEFVEDLMSLEGRLHLLEINLPKVARYTIRKLHQPFERVFGLEYHEYVNRTLCQGRNLLRVTRIDVNMNILLHDTFMKEENQATRTICETRIEGLVKEILASVPYYTGCTNALFDSHSLTTSSIQHSTSHHHHLPHHQSDCYLLLFPLYAAGKATTNEETRKWVLKELKYMHEHFSVRMADVVAVILEGGEDVCVWDVHSTLGCYSFNV